jgi:lauroyl/myristoyl acyltransferase
MFKFLLYKFGQFVVNHLPTAWSYRFARFLSDLQYKFSFNDRRAVCNNLKVILGEKENLPQLTREVFRNFGVYLVEFFRMKHMVNGEFIQNNVSYHHIHNVEKALEKKRGAILLTAHLGNWEMGGAITGYLGYPLTAVALPHKERPVNDLFNSQRESKGITVVPINQAIRKCMEALKKNEIVALVADRDFNMNGEVMNFLGRKAIIPRGPAVLSLRTGAPIIPSFFVRVADGKFDLTIHDPIFPPENMIGKDDREGMLKIMNTYLPVIENEIRKYPTQWLMFREFWVK